MAVFIEGKQVRCHVCEVWPTPHVKEQDPVIRCQSKEIITYLDGHRGPIVRYYCANHHRGRCGEQHRWIGSIKFFDIPRKRLLEKQRQAAIESRPIIPGFVRNRDRRAAELKKKQEENQ